MRTPFLLSLLCLALGAPAFAQGKAGKAAPKGKGAAKKPVAPASWLDQNRAVEQLTWHPAEATLIHDRVVHSGGWSAHAGATVFNLYRAPTRNLGDPKKAGPWRDHLRRVYPSECEHIERWRDGG